MKKLSVLLSIVLFSCSSAEKDRNELMTKLINQKKASEEGISACKYLEDDFMQRARLEIRSSHDSLKFKPLIDSSTFYYMQGYTLKKRLEETQFSIDSLSKMK